MDESSLRDLMFRFPRSLPVAAIDAAYSDPVPICRELYTPAGYVDALYINALGRLILAEFKLWRNPQARREVIGQILDYTKELASWRYEDLQREVSRALKRTGNVPYELVRAQAPDVDEKEFVDNVSRHLRRGEFLLLIVGDGIREGVENIVNFVQSHSGLHFNLALVEAALYRDTVNRIIVQPRVLTRTEVVRRVVVEGGFVEDLTAEVETTLARPTITRRTLDSRAQTYAFSDVTVELPEGRRQLYVKVQRSGVTGDCRSDRNDSSVGVTWPEGESAGRRLRRDRAFSGRAGRTRRLPGTLGERRAPAGFKRPTFPPKGPTTDRIRMDESSGPRGNRASRDLHHDALGEPSRGAQEFDGAGGGEFSSRPRVAMLVCLTRFPSRRFSRSGDKCRHF